MIALVALAFAQEPTPIRCCSHPAVQHHLRHYLRLEQSLAGENRFDPSAILFAWDGRAQKLVGALEGPDGETLAALATLTRNIKAKRTDAIRSSFQDFSRLVIPLVNRYQGGSLEVFEARCEDRIWLQPKPEGASPYPDCDPVVRDPTP